jgi:hypothetical protein
MSRVELLRSQRDLKTESVYAQHPRDFKIRNRTPNNFRRKLPVDLSFTNFMKEQNFNESSIRNGNQITPTKLKDPFDYLVQKTLLEADQKEMKTRQSRL